MSPARYLTPFIGRDHELGWIRARALAGQRLITLFGPPGVGKTRLAVEALEAAAHEGVATFFCDLASARSEEEAAEIVLSVLTPLGGNRKGDMRSAVGAALRDRGPSMIVLDNFEQLTEVASFSVAAWVAQCPNATFLVTSREVLRVPGELAREILPLPVPANAAELANAPSARMLLEAIGRYQSNVDVGELEPDGLLDVLARLEGIPLAIEIIAPRIALLGLPVVQERLMAVLTSGANALRTPMRATRTLHEALAWSWELLTLSEKRALAQSTVFRGGFSLEALSAVLNESDAEDALDLLSRLRDKSLIRHERGASASPPRFGFYATIGHFAGEQLESLGLAAEARERHMTYFANLAQRAASGVRDAIAMVDAETDNLVAALEGALADDASRRATPIRSLMLTLPLLSKVSIKRRLALFDAGLRAFPLGQDIESAALILARAEILSYAAHGQDAVVELQLERGLDIVRALGAPALEARILARLGFALVDAEPERAMGPLEEAVRLAHQLGNATTEAGALGAMVFAQLHMGNDQAAWELQQREREAVARTPSLRQKVIGSIHTATLHVIRREMRLALELLSEALEMAKEVRPSKEAFVLWSLGMAHHVDGALDDAEWAYRESLARHVEQLLPYFASVVRMTLAILLLERDRPEEMRAELERVEPEFVNYRAAAVMVPALRSIADGLAFGQPIDLLPHIRSAGETRQLVLLLSRLTDKDANTYAGSYRRVHSLETAILESAILRKHGAASVEEAIAPGALDEGRASETLLVHVRGGWFRRPGSEIVDCHGRHAIRRLLLALAHNRRKHPGASLTVEELQNVGWPDERMSADAARNRLRHAISTLRKMGLGNTIVWQDNGYLITESIEVAFAERHVGVDASSTE